MMSVDIEKSSFNDDENKADNRTEESCSKCWPVKTDDSTGYMLSSFGSGAVIASNFFLSTAFLELAKREAGCIDEDDDDEEYSVCEKKVYGFKPASLILLIPTISGVMSAFLLPVVGAMIDYTPYRRTLFAIFSCILLSIQGAQVATMETTWFIMIILQAINGFIFDGVSISRIAYLLEIATDVGEEVMTSYAGYFNASFYVSQLGFIITNVAIMIGAGLDEVGIARIAQGFDVVVSGIFYYLAWTFFSNTEGKELPENDSLILAGFKQNFRTIKGMYQHYRSTLFLYFIAVLFQQTGVQTFTVVANTYLLEQLDFGGLSVSIIFIVVMCSIIPGGFLGSFVTRKTDPKKAMILCLTCFIVANFIGFLVLNGPDKKNLVYIFAVIWGVLIGWCYTTDSLLFSLICPKGQESEFSGFNQYCSKVLTWLPPLVFTLMFESGINMSWGGVHLNIYLFLSICFYYSMEPWEKAVLNGSTRNKITDTS